MVQLSCTSSGVYIYKIIYTVSWEKDGSLIVMGKESGGGQISVKMVGLEMQLPFRCLSAW